jgi:NAD-dependent DNA ligase
VIEQTIIEKIRQRRRQCIVHRVIYYCFDTNIVSDYKYSQWEKELRELCKQYPEEAKQVEYYEFCPSHKVGSSDISTYPPELVKTAERLLRRK